MKIRLPIIVVDEKEMYERDEAEFLAEKGNASLESLGILEPDSYTTPFAHTNDRVVTYILDLNDVKSFYQNYIHLNDKELEGVRVRQMDGYWPPIFIIPFKKFEQLYVKHQRGGLLNRADDIILDWEEALNN